MEYLIIKKYTRKITIEYDFYTVVFSTKGFISRLGSYLCDLSKEEYSKGAISWLKGDECFGPFTEEYYIDREDGICSIWCRFDENEDGYCPEDMRDFLTEKNMMHVLQEWKKAMMFEPNYIILQEDDSGWVDLSMKEKLSDKEAKDYEDNPSFFTFDEFV